MGLNGGACSGFKWRNTGVQKLIFEVHDFCDSRVIRRATAAPGIHAVPHAAERAALRSQSDDRAPPCTNIGLCLTHAPMILALHVISAAISGHTPFRDMSMLTSQLRPRRPHADVRWGRASGVAGTRWGETLRWLIRCSAIKSPRRECLWALSGTRGRPIQWTTLSLPLAFGLMCGREGFR